MISATTRCHFVITKHLILKFTAHVCNNYMSNHSDELRWYSHAFVVVIGHAGIKSINSTSCMVQNMTDTYCVTDDVEQTMCMDCTLTVPTCSPNHPCRIITRIQLFSVQMKTAWARVFHNHLCILSPAFWDQNVIRNSKRLVTDCTTDFIPKENTKKKMSCENI